MASTANQNSFAVATDLHNRFTADNKPITVNQRNLAYGTTAQRNYCAIGLDELDTMVYNDLQTSEYSYFLNEPLKRSFLKEQLEAYLARNYSPFQDGPHYTVATNPQRRRCTIRVNDQTLFQDGDNDVDALGNVFLAARQAGLILPL